MTTLILILIFCGSFCFYNTSKKAILNNSTIEKLLQTNTKISKVSGGLSYITALIICLETFGTTSGIFYWFLLILVILCLTIILAPTRTINYKHLMLVFSVLVIIQFLNY